jgi:hypothetical protein
MVLENSHAFQEIIMRDNGKTISLMEMESQFKQTETCIKDSGSKIKEKEKEYSNL